MSLQSVKNAAKAMYLVFTDLFSKNDIRTETAYDLAVLVSSLPDDISESDRVIRDIEMDWDDIKYLMGRSIGDMRDHDNQNLCLQVMNDFYQTFSASDIFEQSLHRYTYYIPDVFEPIRVYATNMYDAIWQVAQNIARQGLDIDEIDRIHLYSMDDEDEE